MTENKQHDNKQPSATHSLSLKRREEAFIRTHAGSDIRRLALLADRYPDIDMTFALDQIAGRRTAQSKLPAWAKTMGIVYPPHLSMEQCSSEQTARYKARLAWRLAGLEQDNSVDFSRGNNTSFIDLTGGLGVDFSFIARRFASCTYVERQDTLCRMAANNFPLLGLEHAKVVHADGVEYLQHTEPADIIYIDPARRNGNGGKTVFISHCTPDILEIIETLTEKARFIIVKLSPMLDRHKAVEEINRKDDFVREIHIIGVKNECKELVFVLGKTTDKTGIRITCSNDETSFSYTEGDETERFLCILDEPPESGMYLYEPYAALMKAGCFAPITHRFDVQAIASNSHLFVSRRQISGFPGRIFRISAVSSLNKKELKTSLQNIGQANITVRNFPMSAPDLRKRLKLRDGGNTYIFATTTQKGAKCLLIARKPEAEESCFL